MLEVCGDSGAFSPWSRFESEEPWFSTFSECCDNWRCDSSLELDVIGLKEALFRAAEEQMRWLIHPCSNAVTLAGSQAKFERDLQLAIWVNLNDPQFESAVKLSEPIWVWSEAGGVKLDAGIHKLSEIAEVIKADTEESLIAIDPWARSVRVSFLQLWSDAEPFGREEKNTLNSELLVLLRSLQVAESTIPECSRWITHSSRVVVPLQRPTGAHSTSSSSATIPATVFITVHDEIQVIEALTHETGHQQFFIREAGGPLVKPDHKERYKSPLRSDPRPLRGVFLAYHALVFMSAYYRDALEQEITSSSVLEPRFRSVVASKRDAEMVLLQNKKHLTSDGRHFLEQTLEVGKYSEAR